MYEGKMISGTVRCHMRIFMQSTTGRLRISPRCAFAGHTERFVISFRLSPAID